MQESEWYPFCQKQNELDKIINTVLWIKFMSIWSGITACSAAVTIAPDTEAPAAISDNGMIPCAVNAAYPAPGVTDAHAYESLLWEQWKTTFYEKEKSRCILNFTYQTNGQGFSVLFSWQYYRCCQLWYPHFSLVKIRPILIRENFGSMIVICFLIPGAFPKNLSYSNYKYNLTCFFLLCNKTLIWLI